MFIKQRKSIFILLGLTLAIALIFTITPLQANDNNIPDWLKRFEYSVEVQTNKNLNFIFKPSKQYIRTPIKPTPYFINHA